mmetsp:Transcript_56926/g.176602  ORF Transcript_56926/g.176602 Transcript_56926/m.176602 type:complete len:232 (-) Transcript_56926:378-1073(-)
MTSASSNIHKKPSPRSSSRTPSATKSLSRTSSQRRKRSAVGLPSFAMAKTSEQKASKASAQVFKPAFAACWDAGAEFFTASSIVAASSDFARVSRRTSCLRPAKASNAAIHAASFSTLGLRLWTPRMPRMRSTKAAALLTGSSTASGKASKAGRQSETSLDRQSMTLAVLKLSRSATPTASSQAFSASAKALSRSPEAPLLCSPRRRKRNLPRKCFSFRSSALAMSMAWSE